MYPELKANQQYNVLMAELQGTENTIRAARVSYNSVVRSYNIYIQKFPNNIIANAFTYQKELMYENEEASNVAPKLDMKLD